MQIHSIHYREGKQAKTNFIIKCSWLAIKREFYFIKFNDFSISRELCNHDLDLILEHFHRLRESPHTFTLIIFSPFSWPPETLLLLK